MKKALFLLAVSAVTLSCYSQQTLSKEDYLEKSKRKKTTGFVLLGTGVVLATTGALILQTSGNDLNSFNEDIAKGLVLVAGISSAIVSIPFFISAANNKKKAMALSFKNEKTMQVSGNTVAVQYYPAVSFKVRL